MSKKKNKYSTCKVVSRKTKKVKGYLSKRDEENGLDAKLDMMGFDIIAL